MRVGFVARSWLILVIRWYASRCVNQTFKNHRTTPYSKCSKFVAYKHTPGRSEILNDVQF